MFPKWVNFNKSNLRLSAQDGEAESHPKGMRRLSRPRNVIVAIANKFGINPLWLWLLGVVASLLVVVAAVLSSRSVAAEPRKLLVLYAYKETKDARRNAKFFIRHGLHDNATFVFILNGETDLERLIPKRHNIRVVKRPNTCYDLGSYGEVLQANNRALVKKHNLFILLNASIRGPFVPHWSNACWSTAYTNKITKITKLVGMTFNCVGPGGPLMRHVQSMIWATDRKGLDVLLTPDGLAACHNEYADAVATEIRATTLILNAGYNVDVMMTSFHSTPLYGGICNHIDPLYPEGNFGGTIHPYETLFFKTKRHMLTTTAENLSRWTRLSNYTSYDHC